MRSYYVTLADARISNPQVVPFLLLARWYGQQVGSDMHLAVSHRETADQHSNIVGTKFHKILLDDVDDSERSPFRKARLRLEGKDEVENGIFGLLEWLDLDRLNTMRSCYLKLSPVPFGSDGRPKLPFKDENLEFFLKIVSIVLKEPVGYRIDPEKLAEKVQTTLSLPYYEFDDSKAWYWLGEMLKLGLVSNLSVRDRIHETTMGLHVFRQIFMACGAEMHNSPSSVVAS